jgi:sugar phosphate isomerase/epimerase
MFTVRNSLEKDPMGTLEQVAAAGYNLVEFANHYAETDGGIGFGDIPVKQLKAKVNDLGIRVLAGQIKPFGTTRFDLIPTFYYDEDRFKHFVSYYKEIGADYLIVPIDFFPTKDILMKRCELYNRLGELCIEGGMKFLYHNHFHEFQTFGEDIMFDLIVKNTDPAKVNFCFDAYWTIRGAYDPVEKIRTYGNRIAYIHEKDFPLDKAHELNIWRLLDQASPIDGLQYKSSYFPEQFIEVGDGIIKIQEVIDACNDFDIPYLLVEQDHTKLTEIGSIRKSMANMKKYRGIEWD